MKRNLRETLEIKIIGLISTMETFNQMAGRGTRKLDFCQVELWFHSKELKKEEKKKRGLV